MKGYFGSPDATTEILKDGRLHSGDIAVMNANGLLEILDRKKDMILVSSFNIPPNEIEDVITTLDGVVEVGVIGSPDERSSDTPMAFIVKSDSSLTEEAGIAHCREGLINYKGPERIALVDDRAKAPVGKVLRPASRELVTTC